MKQPSSKTRSKQKRRKRSKHRRENTTKQQTSSSRGKILIEKAEQFAASQGAWISGLGTSDDQAPWFYEKVGYTKIMTSPRMYKTLDGKWCNDYSYRKQIADIPSPIQLCEN